MRYVSYTKRIRRNKISKLRYAIKTKVFSDTKTTLKKCLEVSEDWATFTKNDWSWKDRGHVAGAEFDIDACEYKYILKQDGTIKTNACDYKYIFLDDGTMKKVRKQK